MQNPAPQSVASRSPVELPLGSSQKRNMNSAAPAIMNAQTRGARPPAHLSVAHPEKIMPAMPDISNSATIQPACSSVTPFASFSSVGPQSRTEKRTRLMVKLQPPSHQKTRREKIIL